MSATAVNIQSNIKAAYQEISNSKERLEMNIAKSVNAVKEWLSVRVTGRNPFGVLGGLALGAFLMTITALPWGATSADGPARPVSTGPSYQEQRLADTIEERMEARRLLEDLFSYGPVSAPSAYLDQGQAGYTRAEREELIGIAENSGPAAKLAGRPLSTAPRLLTKVETDDDAWIFDAPFYDSFHDSDSLDGARRVPSIDQQRIAESIEERLEVQRLLADTPNLGVTPASAGVPDNAESIEERLEVQRVLSMTLEQ